MTAAEIKAAAIRYGERALQDSRQRLGEKAWAEHGDWVEDFVVECARQWAIDQSQRQRS